MTFVVVARLERLNLYVQDDGYYYLLVARNWLERGFPSFDGVELTTGFQPLWQVLGIPAALSGDLGTQLRLLLVVAALLLQAGLLMLAVWLARTVAGLDPLAALLALEAHVYLVWLIGLNGMESALQVALLGAVALWFSRPPGSPARRSLLVLGLLVGLYGVGRFDGLALVGSAGVVLLRRGLRWRQLVPFAALGLLPAAAALVANQASTGSPLPVSGEVKKYWNNQAVETAGGGPLTRMKLAAPSAARAGFRLLSRTAGGWLYFPGRALGIPHRWLSYTAVAVACLALAIAARRLRGRVGPGFVEFATIVALAGAIRLAFFAWSFPTDFHLYEWYFTGELVLLLALSIVALPRSVAGLPILAVAAASVFIGLPSLWSNSENRAHYLPVEECAAHVRNLLNPGEGVGSWDAGYVGFLLPGKVTNLDGLINSQAYFHEVIAGDRPLEAYLEQRRIRYVVNMTGGETPDSGRDYRGLSRGTFVVDFVADTRLAPYDQRRSCVVLRLVSGPPAPRAPGEP